MPTLPWLIYYGLNTWFAITCWRIYRVIPEDGWGSAPPPTRILRSAQATFSYLWSCCSVYRWQDLRSDFRLLWILSCFTYWGHIYTPLYPGQLLYLLTPFSLGTPCIPCLVVISPLYPFHLLYPLYTIFTCHTPSMPWSFARPVPGVWTCM